MKNGIAQKLFEAISRVYDERQMLENVCILYAVEHDCYIAVANKDGRLIFEHGSETAGTAKNGYDSGVNELFAKVSIGVNYIGTVTVKRIYLPFDDNDTQMFYAFSSVLGLLFRFIIGQDKENSERAKAAIGSLSYSELSAALYVFEEISGASGSFVSSNIAKQKGVTKSVIVNCLKKLESAGFIEVRSLGVKGTHIKVLNETIVAELNKLKS